MLSPLNKLAIDLFSGRLQELSCQGGGGLLPFPLIVEGICDLCASHVDDLSRDMRHCMSKFRMAGLL